MEEVCQLTTELFKNSDMDSVTPETGANMPCSPKEPPTKALLDSSFESDLGLGPISVKADSSVPTTKQNGLDESIVYEGTSDNNLLDEELQVLFSDSDDMPIDFADERPPSDDDDEPFEIEDLISSSDDEFLEFSAQGNVEDQKQILSKPEEVETAVLEQVDGSESVKKSVEETDVPVTTGENPTEDETVSKKEPGNMFTLPAYILIKFRIL